MIRTTWIAVALGCAMGACGGDEPNDSGGATLGALFALTGPVADVALSSERALQLALEEVNTHGGVMGERLRLAVHDSEVDPALAATQARQILDEEDTDVIVTGLTSAAARAVMEEIAPRGGVQVVALSGEIALTDGTYTDSLFRTLPVGGTSDWIGWWTEQVLEEGHRHILYVTSDAYETVINDARTRLETACQEAAATCTVEVRMYAAEAPISEVRALLSDLSVVAPDALFLYGREPDVIELLKAAESADYSGALLINDLFGAVGPHFVDLLQADTVRRVRWVDAAVGGSAQASVFRQRFQSLHGLVSGPNRAELTSYDAAMIAALAIESAGSTRSPTAADAMWEVANAPGEVVGPFEWERARTLLAAGEDIDYEGFMLTDFSDSGQTEADPAPLFFGWDSEGNVIPWVAP